MSQVPSGAGCAMDEGNFKIAMTGMGNEFGAAAARRVNGADQLSNASQYVFLGGLVSPSVMTGMGYRTTVESGAGRTRAETNRPVETGSAGNT